eukprot:TRINITY_DN11870_c0_g1_i1.p1 TRINITY_DN11870_c0_g1~~TRINITY_DN11870_c0_g1_i1.p1  ORF type:complete len:381 (-),score=29.99 TRINITY_DN11870_c0_g1_i1:225-1367(-)
MHTRSRQEDGQTRKRLEPEYPVALQASKRAKRSAQPLFIHLMVTSGSNVETVAQTTRLCDFTNTSYSLHNDFKEPEESNASVSQDTKRRGVQEKEVSSASSSRSSSSSPPLSPRVSVPRSRSSSQPADSHIRVHSLVSHTSPSRSNSPVRSKVEPRIALPLSSSSLKSESPPTALRTLPHIPHSGTPVNPVSDNSLRSQPLAPYTLYPPISHSSASRATQSSLYHTPLSTIASESARGTISPPYPLHALPPPNPSVSTSHYPIPATPHLLPSRYLSSPPSQTTPVLSSPSQITPVLSSPVLLPSLSTNSTYTYPPVLYSTSLPPRPEARLLASLPFRHPLQSNTLHKASPSNSLPRSQSPNSSSKIPSFGSLLAESRAPH